MTTRAVDSEPFAAALREAIAARGLSLERLRSKLADRGLHVGVTTLSYWQRGLRRPERPDSLRAVAALEEILQVGPRRLSTLLGPPRPRGGAVRYPTGLGRYAAIMPRPSRMTALLERVDMAAAGRLHVVCELNDIEIGPDRTALRATVTQVVQAHTDHADRSVAIMWQDPGSDIADVAIRTTQNCRLGRVRRDLAGGIVVAELLFDSSLHHGDTRVLRYEFVHHDQAECRDAMRAFRFPTDMYVLQVRFDDAALPVRCHRFRAARADARESESAVVTLDSQHTVHLMTRNANVGVVGLRWDWS